jgi:hypothetical protein
VTRVLGALGVLLGVLLAVLLAAAGPAQATTTASGYRYWSFWNLDGGSWVYATQGPSAARPSDGDVQGFRFSVSEDSRDSAKPRGATDFAAICARTPARDGAKRVALVLDFGTSADAPSGETPPRPRTACARVPEDATTAEALATVAKPLRYDAKALLCAIAGYPHTGCGEPVSAPEPSTSHEGRAASNEEGSSSGPSVGLFAGTGAVALLVAAAIWQARRRRV